MNIHGMDGIINQSQGSVHRYLGHRVFSSTSILSGLPAKYLPFTPYYGENKRTGSKSRPITFSTPHYRRAEIRSTGLSVPDLIVAAE